MIQVSSREFKYSLTRKNAFLVVSFTGHIAKPGLNELERCKSEILEQGEVKAMVLDFADVEEIGLDMIPLLAQLQHAVRARQIRLRLCALAEPLLDKLQRKGVIRAAEVAKDLKEALGGLVRA
jgi:anti-anti-sigma regulatory factor